MKSPSVVQRILGFLGRFPGVIALVAVFILGCIYTPLDAHGGRIFLSPSTHYALLFDYADYGLLATGMTLVILTGGIDLSVSSVLGFSAIVFALLSVGYGWSPAVAVPATIAVGALCGFVNGLLVARFRLQAFVATLAMMAAARGLARITSGGIKVQPAAKPWYVIQGASPDFYSWMTTPIKGIGLQPAALSFLVLLAIFAVIVHKTSYGRALFAIGGNEEAARLSGIPVSRYKTVAYVLCGAFAAIAGISNACRLDLGDPQAGVGFELDAIAAVVIGGTSLAGGRGGMFFTFLGVLIMGYINKILSLNQVDTGPRLVIQATIIVLAVLIQRKKGSA